MWTARGQEEADAELVSQVLCCTLVKALAGHCREGAL